MAWDEPYRIRWLERKDRERIALEDKRMKDRRESIGLGVVSIILLLVALLVMQLSLLH